MIQFTTAYHKINALKGKHRIIQGGQGSSKTFSILIILLQLLFTDKKYEILILSDTYPTLKKGVIRIFEKLYRSIGLNWDANYNSTDKLLKHNGHIVQFQNADAHNKLQGLGIRYDYIFVNEAYKMSFPTVEQMINRVRIAVFYDYNPEMEFWIHTEISTRNNVDFISLTYKDNELLPKGEVETIEEKIAASKLPGASSQLLLWVDVYAFGKLGTYSDRQIYAYEFIDKIPDDAKRIPSGMDFGQSPDPTILIDMWIKGANIYIDEVFCENNLMYEKIEGAERMSVVDKLNDVVHKKGQMIIGDSANATTIRDMRKHGYEVFGVKKGRVIDGITEVRAYNLFITKRSQTLKKGIESWFFKVDKNGKIIPEPDGHEPDGLAAARYVIRMKNSRW